MKAILLSTTLLLSCIAAHAQKAKMAVGCKADGSNTIVQIKFLVQGEVISKYQANIYRRQGQGSWEKLNTAPLTKASLTENLNDESYRYYTGYMKRKPAADPQDEKNTQAIAGLVVISNNDFARYAGWYYEDKTAVKGNTYQYRITNAADGDKEMAVSEPFTVQENYLPKVAAITARQVQQNIDLDWEKNSKSFYAYYIYRKGSAKDKAMRLNKTALMLAAIKGATPVKGEAKYTDSSLQAGSDVYYEVTGLDILGNESAPGDAVKVEVKDMLPPAMVRNLKGKKENKDAILTWDTQKDKDIKGYHIYRNNSADTVFKKITTALVTANTYTDKDLGQGTVYGYRVQSVDDAGNGRMSYTAKVFFPDQQPPAKPKGLKAITTPGIVKITWDKNAENDLMGYYIYRASNRNKDYFNMLYVDPVTMNTFIDSLPGVAKNEFVYYIQAVDKNYNLSEPSDTVIATLPDTAAPIEPFIRNITYADGLVTFDADLRTEDGFSYDVYRSDDSANSSNYRQLNKNSLTEKKFTDRIPAKGQLYHYYIVGKDKAGNTSPRSQKQTVYADLDAATTTAAKELKAKFNAADTAVTLSWNNDATDVAGYIVYRQEGDGGFKSVSGVITETRFIDKPVEPGILVRYKVRTLYNKSESIVNSPEIELNTQ